MTPTFIELGDAQMTFVNASQVTTIFIDRDRIQLSTADRANLTFHGDQIEGAAAQQVLVELLTQIGRTQKPGLTRVITYLNGAVQSRYL